MLHISHATVPNGNHASENWGNPNVTQKPFPKLVYYIDSLTHLSPYWDRRALTVLITYDAHNAQPLPFIVLLPLVAMPKTRTPLWECDNHPALPKTITCEGRRLTIICCSHQKVPPLGFYKLSYQVLNSSWLMWHLKWSSTLPCHRA
jgi:hypothetical protein